MNQIAEWDAIAVGGGHDGPATAAYLARASWKVLVLERREHLGGVWPEAPSVNCC
ncbi:MAG TPA: NAD(P)-binding protein [Solirubrobacterales bacterium]|nr:NAD(P)-binding protein [Solirubrobacterales bacterium]